jgi:glycosyltransferase involved in cell wall biosynthesis
MKPKILFLLPNTSKVSTSFDELWRRHAAYLTGLRSSNENDEIDGVMIIGQTKSLDRTSFKFRNLFVSFIENTKFNFFLYPFRVILVIRKSRFIPDWIVAGDSNISLLYALIIKFLYIHSVKVQVSFHGEYGNFRANNIKRVILSIPYRLMKKKIDLIRFVSEAQSREFISKLVPMNSRVVVVPVPIIGFHKVTGQKKRRVLGFVGRLHPERGVEEWANIAQQLTGIEYLVVGSGHLEETMKKLLPSAQFTGYIESSSLHTIWSSISVLLSSAPMESYGMALREALLNGVPVVSRRNAGSVELNQFFPELVRLYDHQSEAIFEINALIKEPPSKELFEEFHKFFYTQQEMSLKALASAWSN